MFSRYVAEEHAEHLRTIAHPGKFYTIISEQNTVILCAAGWHRGEAYMKRPVSRWSKETRDYADRVWNTYEQLKMEGK